VTNTPRGPAIDIFFSQVVAAVGPVGSTPQGSTIDVLQQVVVIASIFWQHLRGATVVNTIATVCATSKIFLCKKKLSPCDSKDSEKTIVMKYHSTKEHQSLFADKRYNGYE
jgi:hypothetical protein